MFEKYCKIFGSNEYWLDSIVIFDIDWKYLNSNIRNNQLG